MKEELEQEYGRVTAKSINKFNEESRTLTTIYLPQFEVIKYKPSSGKTVSETFVCISDDTTESGIVECKTELEALEYALKYRNKL